MAPPAQSDWDAACLRALFGLTHGKKGKATEASAVILYDAIKADLGQGGFGSHWAKGSATSALERLEQQGRISKTVTPMPPGKKSRQVWGQLGDKFVYSLTETGIRDARVASGLSASAPTGKGRKAK